MVSTGNQEWPKIHWEVLRHEEGAVILGKDGFEILVGPATNSACTMPIQRAIDEFHRFADDLMMRLEPRPGLATRLGESK
jgi:hypothetical protein